MEEKKRNGQYRDFVSVEPKHHLRTFWKQLINLGYAENLRELSLKEALAQTQSRIGFRYGRICRIIDLIAPLSSGNVGTVQYDYTDVFDLLSQVLAHGMIPFLELGNKYFNIQESTNQFITPAGIQDPAEYFEDLGTLLPDFMRACINYYGQEVVDTWCFEISYGFMDAPAIRENFGLIPYMQQFRKLYRILRSFSGKCRIGGPGFNDWSSQEAIESFLRLYQQYRITPDFFTVYAYPVVDYVPEQTGGQFIILSGDRKLSIRRIRSFTKAVRAAFPKKEVWVTEFNSNLSSRSFLNDSAYQAAYLAEAISALAPLRIQALGYYLLSDAPLRYRNAPDLLFGGWGLMTDTGIPKASFRMLELLSQLGHYAIRQTGECWICADSRGRIQILLHRLCSLAQYALTNNVEKEDLASPDLVFTHRGTDIHRLELGGLYPGRYILREYHVNQAMGNLFSVWRDCGFMTPDLQSTLEEFQTVTSCTPTFQTCDVREDGLLTLDLSLTDNEVLLLCADLAQNSETWRQVPKNEVDGNTENESEDAEIRDKNTI